MILLAAIFGQPSASSSRSSTCSYLGRSDRSALLAVLAAALAFRASEPASSTPHRGAKSRGRLAADMPLSAVPGEFERPTYRCLSFSERR